MNWSGKLGLSVALLVIFYTVGYIGLDQSSYAYFFEQISPANILLSFTLLLWCHESKTDHLRLVGFVSAVMIMGITVEILGITTGMIFGSYHYTRVLGPAILGVPLIIGVNWAMLTYTAAVISSRFTVPSWARVIIGALIMVACDLLLEGFAIRHHFWVCEGSGRPPMMNYVGWVIVSAVSNAIYIWLIPDSKNKLAPIYLLVFLAFLIADKLI